jgi:CO/xanthine dehydrogenase Mo-binding subunit
MATVFDSPEFRLDGPLKVTGRARYTADLHLPGMLRARFLLSPHPHARIVSIDTSAARRVPGVHAVLTGADIGERRFGRNVFDWPVLAYERVLFVGERVAAVAAETREAAEEAVGLIEVEYEELPAVVDAEAALAPDAPVLHPRFSDYHALNRPEGPLPHPNLQGYSLVTKGDVERGFAEADHVFEDTYTAPRQHQGYLEPHGCVVWFEEQGQVRVRTTNKSPFALRQQLATVTGEPIENIVVDSRFIGGDFGGKGLSIDDYACYYLARATGRPVKSMMTFADEMLAGTPRHNTVCTLRTGVTREGKIIAHAWRAIYNGGAYQAPKPMVWPLDTWSALQAYAIPNCRQEQLVVYTNSAPSGHVRAPGAVQMALAGEGHIDHIARQMGIDPLQFRLLNALRPGDSGPARERYRNPRAVEVLETIRDKTAWASPLPPNHGRGVALRHREVGQGKSSAVLRLLPDGHVEVLYGTPDQGSGSATVVRRVAAEVLSIEPERIVVRYGDTSEAPMDPGAGASRVTHVIGRATQAGATILKTRLEELAAEVLGWPAGEVRIEADHFVAGAERRPFEEVAAKIARGGPVEERGAYDSVHYVPHPDGPEDDYNFYAYMVEVAVDPDTGQVRVLDAVAAIDVGQVINPVAHQGQLEGAFVYGLGNAVMEEMHEAEGRLLTPNLNEYKLPTQMDVPPLRTMLVHTDVGPGPFGAKAAGEITNSGVAAAVANAVYDAVGVRIMTLPVTAERVFEALHGE